MFNHSKPSFWSKRGAPEAPEPSVDISRLEGLMSQLDAGIAQSTERERATQARNGRPEIQMPMAAQAAATEAATAASVTAQAASMAAITQVATPAAPPVKKVTKIEAAKAEPVKVEHGTIDDAEPLAVETDDETSEALRKIAEQRKAAEALLLEAVVLEERIKKEAETAKITRAYESAVKKADGAAAKAKSALAAEQEAQQRAESSSHDYALVTAELQDVEKLLAAKRIETDAAKAVVVQLERQLQDAHKAAEALSAEFTKHESLKRECALRESSAVRSAEEAAARVVACKAEREAAEAEAEATKRRVEALKSQVAPVQQTGTMEDMQRLVSRIAEQARMSRTPRNGSMVTQLAS